MPEVQSDCLFHQWALTPTRFFPVYVCKECGRTADAQFLMDEHDRAVEYGNACMKKLEDVVAGEVMKKMEDIGLPSKVAEVVGQRHCKCGHSEELHESQCFGGWPCLKPECPCHQFNPDA